MAGLQICPNCFAEVYEALTCAFCGAEIPNEPTEFKPNINLSNTLVPFELAGEWIQRRDWQDFPKGTLFIERFSLLQFKQKIGTGDCFIAFDHHDGHHCFVTLWKEPDKLSAYHHRIHQLSPVYAMGSDPTYSAFLPQEGRPLIETLHRLGWSHGRVWEVFRQMSHLMSIAHANSQTIGGFHPDNCWITPTGKLEMSLQPKKTVGPSSIQQDVQHLIFALGWLFGQSKTIEWKQFPLILRSILQKHWANSDGADDLWTDLQNQIQSGGWYRLQQSVRDELFERHCPGRLSLAGEVISVPDTVQLCVWNSVTASWRLHEGQVVLRSTIESLYENGFLDSNDFADRLNHFSRVVSHQEDALLSEDLTEIYWHLLYGNRNQARLMLSRKIPLIDSIPDWILLIQGFHSLDEHKEAKEIVSIAKHSVNSLRDGLELASAIRWFLNDISSCRRYLIHLTSMCTSPWDWLDWVEASLCLLNWTDTPSTVRVGCETSYQTLGEADKREYKSVMWLRFGSIGERLFPWISNELVES